MADRDPESENAVAPKTPSELMEILQRSAEEERAKRHQPEANGGPSPVVKGMIGVPGAQFQALEPSADEPVSPEEEGGLDAETFALDVWYLGAPATLNVYSEGPPVP